VTGAAIPGPGSGHDVRVKITHIGGPTTLIELDGWRLLTDPTFDPPGRRYAFGLGTSSRKVAGPAVPADALGDVDAVLLTHDHHADNLDDAGRALLPAAGAVITTPAGAGRLGGTARGLAPWDRTVLDAPGRAPLEVTATPGRHGPPLSGPVVGQVTGFAVRVGDGPVLWISGDTVLYGGVRQVADRFDVDVAVVHLGAVRFPTTRSLKYTMTAADAAVLCAQLKPRAIVPVHYEGWSHFSQGRAAAEADFAAAPAEVSTAVRWLEPGVPAEI
jgi:L-ascorbate metabolism protein UlaG (beta-lactamase superfamily)